MTPADGTPPVHGLADYDPEAVEAKWQARWAEAGCFKAPVGTTGDKFFNFDGGPFPNGPLHMGHVRTFTLGDVMARYQRMRGKRVLYAFEFDAFGLPNELAAEAAGIAPQALTEANIRRMRAQMTRLGLSYDWDRVTVTCDPHYYRWTQWLFLKLRERRLIYRAEAELNWCPSCHTTLAHMQVEDGRCWRCETAVEQKSLTQWFVALSRYSAKLAAGLEAIEGFSPRVRNVLRGFLGATAGIEIDFDVAERPGARLTAFMAGEAEGAMPAYLAVAPNHPCLAALLPTETIEAIKAGIEPAGRVRRRDAGEVPLDGVDTTLTAIDPGSGLALPIFVASYVDGAFATGIEIGCPGRVPRDRAFAARNGIPLPASAVSLRGRAATQYRVRDWLVSRQRAWGTPIPIVHCESCGEVPVPEDALPVRLPDPPPRGVPGGLRAVPGFAETTCPTCRRPARRETDTLDCYFDVIWCFLSCAAPLDADFSFRAEDFAASMPVDWFHNGLDSFFYMHLYRFIGLVLHEAGLLADPEPIRRYVGHDAVLLDGRKMSKHHGNVVAPDDILAAVGADVLRVHILWAANPLKSVEWTDTGLKRAERLLAEARRVVERAVRCGLRPPGAEPRSLAPSPLQRAVDNAVRRVTEFLERYQYGGCLQEIQGLIQRLSDAVERLETQGGDPRLEGTLWGGIERLPRLLAPFAPHLAEEMWERIGGSGLVAMASWPAEPPRDATAEAARASGASS